MAKKMNKILLVESLIILFLLAVIAVLLYQTVLGEREKNLNFQSKEEFSAELETEPAEMIVEQENAADTVTENITEEPAPLELNEQAIQAHRDAGTEIVVFGDSIWDNWRDETGVAYQVSEQTGATVYNCAIGGSRATSDSDNTDVTGNWNSQSLNTMMYIARKELTPEGQLDGLAAFDVIKSIDFSTVDYVIFSYGLNDYFFNVPVDEEAGMYEMDTYMGALRHAANKMREYYPNLQVIFITPTYCDLWPGEDDCTNYNFGNGVLPDYVNGMITASEQVNTYCLNMYERMGMNADNLKEYSDDGVHFNQLGRERYAQIVAEYLNSIM